MNRNNQTNSLFTETQTFRQWWIWLILIGANGLTIYGTYQQLFLGIPFGNNPTNNTMLLVIVGFMLALSLFLFCLRLDTEIDAEGVHVRMFPLQKKYRHYPWDTIKKSYIRTYRPILEYGGWGIRFGIMGRGRALNVSGNKGLQLEFTDGKRLLIGTQKPEEITAILKN